jgi:hypothetical protein
MKSHSQSNDWKKGSILGKLTEKSFNLTEKVKKLTESHSIWLTSHWTQNQISVKSQSNDWESHKSFPTPQNHPLKSNFPPRPFFATLGDKAKIWNLISNLNGQFKRPKKGFAFKQNNSNTIDQWNVFSLVECFLNKKSCCMDILVILNTITKAWVSPDQVVTAWPWRTHTNGQSGKTSSLTRGGPLCLSWLQVILVRFPRIRKYPLKDLLEKPYFEPLGVLW